MPRAKQCPHDAWLVDYSLGRVWCGDCQEVIDDERLAAEGYLDTIQQWRTRAQNDQDLGHELRDLDLPEGST